MRTESTSSSNSVNAHSGSPGESDPVPSAGVSETPAANGGQSEAPTPDPQPSVDAGDGDGDPSTAEASEPEPANPEDRRIRGKVSIGPMRGDRRSFTVLDRPSLRELIEREFPDDAIIIADKESDLWFLDIDNHGGAPLSKDALAATLTGIHPQGNADWTTHGGGLRVLFIGEKAEHQALAAALSVPKHLGVEIKRDSRHPRSRSSKPGHGPCGPVSFHFGESSTFSFMGSGKVDRKHIDVWCAEHGVDVGSRYDHNRCPIDAHGSDSKGSVQIGENGIYCYRCAGHGVAFPGIRKAGWVPWQSLVGTTTVVTALGRLVKNRVHWTHARFELRDLHPNMSDDVLKRIYRHAINEKYVGADPIISAVFNENIHVVLTRSGWAYGKDFRPANVDTSLAGYLPYSKCAVMGKSDKSKKMVKIDIPRRAQVKDGCPNGYRFLRPYRGITFRDDSDEIAVEIPSNRKYPIRLLTNPMPMDEIKIVLDKVFPRMVPEYLLAVVAGGICAERGGGRPPMLAITGVSGAGKEQTAALAASFFGDRITKVQLEECPETMMRNLGTPISQGARFIAYDELGKSRKLSHALSALLQIGSTIDYRQIYGQVRSTIPMSAMVLFPCVRFPDFLKKSAEFNRRVRNIYLPRKAEEWQQTCGGDINKWRDRSEQNACLGNSVLTYAWQLCRRHNDMFDAIADELGLGRLSDGETLDRQALIALYRYAHGDFITSGFAPVFFTNHATFIRGWINGDSPAAKRFLAPLMPGDDDDKWSIKNLQANLESIDWTSELELDTPVKIRLKIHGAQFGFRFEKVERVMRGQEVINEQLPSVRESLCIAICNEDGGSASGAGTSQSYCQSDLSRNDNNNHGTQDSRSFDPLSAAGFPSGDIPVRESVQEGYP